MDERETDVRRIHATVANVAHHIDTKRWDALLSLFANEVFTDYTSLFGGTPLRQSRDQLIDGWRHSLAHVATQHLLGPIEIDMHDAAAAVQCHVRALHRLEGAPGGELWEVFGHYRFQLHRTPSGWHITDLTLETLLQTGNRSLLAPSSD